MWLCDLSQYSLENAGNTHKISYQLDFLNCISTLTEMFELGVLQYSSSQ